MEHFSPGEADYIRFTRIHRPLLRPTPPIADLNALFGATVRGSTGARPAECGLAAEASAVHGEMRFNKRRKLNLLVTRIHSVVENIINFSNT